MSRHLFKACHLLGLSVGTVHKILWRFSTPHSPKQAVVIPMYGQISIHYWPLPLLIAYVFYGWPHSSTLHRYWMDSSCIPIIARTEHMKRKVIYPGLSQPGGPGGGNVPPPPQFLADQLKNKNVHIVVPFAYLLSSYSNWMGWERSSTGSHIKLERLTNLLYYQEVSLKAR